LCRKNVENNQAKENDFQDGAREDEVNTSSLELKEKDGLTIRGT